MAEEKSYVLRFSTLFTAQNIRDLISDEEGIEKTLEWYRQTAVTHIYVGSFRNGYTAEVLKADISPRSMAAFRIIM